MSQIQKKSDNSETSSQITLHAQTITTMEIEADSQKNL